MSSSTLFNSYVMYVSVRCLLDTDDEVRDRATFYVSILQEKEKALSSGYILNGG